MEGSLIAEKERLPSKDETNRSNNLFCFCGAREKPTYENREGPEIIKA